VNPSLITAMNFLLNSTKKETKRISAQEDSSCKEELKKINSMSFFDAIKYLKKK
jgi:hypothetical protein